MACIPPVPCRQHSRRCTAALAATAPPPAREASAMPALQSRLVPIEDAAEQRCGQAESQWHGQPLQGSPDPMGATYVPHLVSTAACSCRPQALRQVMAVACSHGPAQCASFLVLSAFHWPRQVSLTNTLLAATPLNRPERCPLEHCLKHSHSPLVDIDGKWKHSWLVWAV